MKPSAAGQQGTARLGTIPSLVAYPPHGTGPPTSERNVPDISFAKLGGRSPPSGPGRDCQLVEAGGGAGSGAERSNTAPAETHSDAMRLLVDGRGQGREGRKGNREVRHARARVCHP